MSNKKIKLRKKSEIMAEADLIEFVFELVQKNEAHLDYQDLMALLGYKRALLFVLGKMGRWARELEKIGAHNRFVSRGMRTLVEQHRMQKAINEREKNELQDYLRGLKD